MSVMDSLLGDIYPVGSFYFCTQSTCPMSSLISGSTWEKVGSSIITSVNTNVPIKGTGINLGLTNGTQNGALYNSGTSGTWMATGYYGDNIGSTTGGTAITNNKGVGVTTDSSKSGIVGTVTRSSLTVNIFKRTA